MITVRQQHPVYGTNYGPGWIGFISRKDDFVAAGIDWFSRWDETSHVPVSHTFNIVGSDLTVEAFENGVCEGSIDSYLNDPDATLLVRKPRGLTPAAASAIVRAAESHLDDLYNNRLIAALGASNTFLGHWLNKLTNGGYGKWLCQRADRPDEWICSKLVATTLQETGIPFAYGVMTQPPCTLMPIDLFEDIFVFESGAIELVPEDHPLES